MLSDTSSEDSDTTDSDSDSDSDSESDSDGDEYTAGTEPLGTVRAAYDFEAGEDNEIDLRVNDIITVLEKHESGYVMELKGSLDLTCRRWWAGQNVTTGKYGLFPITYC